MREFTLDGRLASAAKFVRQGAEFADIGTDHAYLPLSLLREGRIEHAVCSDINEGPLDSARANAKEAGLYEKMTFVLTDGAGGLSKLGITDYAICGMGGELIADIIERAPQIKQHGVRLILQPMSRQGHLRHYLSQAGFEIAGESYSYSQRKYYVTICAEYTGVSYELSDVDAELGCPDFLDTGVPECLGYLTAKKRAYKKIADGKLAGAEDARRETYLYEYIEKLLDTGRKI